MAGIACSKRIAVVGYMTENDLDISVVICTRDRTDHLKKCLDSILVSDSLYREIMVIDGSRTRHNRDRVKKIVKNVGGKYFYEGRSGLSFARNLGVKKAAGDIIVFADDDFIVENGWITNLVENYKDDLVACCTGRMVSYRNDYISNLFESSLSKERGVKKRIFTKEGICFSALLKNVRLITRRWLGDEAPIPWSIGFGYFSVKKSVVNEVGFFDESLGVGTPSLGGEEVDMFYRILKVGYKVVYEPTAIIYHDHRQNLNGVFKAAYDAGCSEGAFVRKHFKNDMYVNLFGVGAFFFHVFSLIRTLLEPNSRFVRRLEFERLRGFMAQVGR